MGGSPIGRSLLMFGVVVAVAAVAIALRGHNGPPKVSEVPRALPASGVAVNGIVVLKRLAQRPAQALSKVAAISAAHKYGIKHDYPARAIEAAVTISGDPHLQSTPAWIVTFTYPKPVNVSQPGTPVLVRHDNILVDVASGKFLLGFYTK